MPDKAAEQLYMTQPSLSKAIANLEAELNIRVFERSRNGVEMTEEGRKLYVYAKAILERTELIRQLGVHGADIPETLTLATYPIITMGRWFTEYCNRHKEPYIHLKMIECRTMQAMEMVENGRYDFAIVSRYAAEKYIEENNSLSIIMSFGKNSYAGKHVLMLHNSKHQGIQNGMKVGIDESSFDQIELSKLVCKGKKVEYVPIEYSRTIECVISGDIDATVMNVDEVIDKNVSIHYVDIKGYNDDNSEAVVVSAINHEEIGFILKEIIKTDTVLNIQKLVMQDNIIPRY